VRYHRIASGAVAIVMGTFLLSGCISTGGGGPASDRTPDFSPSASGIASELLDSARFTEAMAEPARVMINVHVPFEGAIADSDRMTPYDRVGTDATLPNDTETPLAIYCRTGRMSTVAATTLAELGYKDVVELDSGMDAWVTSGRMLLSEPRA